MRMTVFTCAVGGNGDAAPVHERVHIDLYMYIGEIGSAVDVHVCVYS